MKTTIEKMGGDRLVVTFPSYKTKDADGRAVTVPKYTNVIRKDDADEYIARVESERAKKPHNWRPR